MKTENVVFKQSLARFKSNRRGYISFLILAFILAISALAPFIASEKPLLVVYKGQAYFPVLKEYPETTFGGTFESATNYRDQTVKDLINADGFIIFPPVPYSASTVNYNLTEPAPSRPTFENWLGTDDHGRDVLARLIYGIRSSLIFGLLLTFAASIIGTAVGAIQGYFGGKVDLIGQRALEIWSGMPILYVLILLSSVMEPSFGWLLIVVLLFSWMPMVGVVRAEFLRARTLDYVKAAEALGVPTYRIIWRHILPNAMVAGLTYIPFILNGSIATLTSLDFLGFGLPPGSASLGEMITQAKNNIQAPWIGLTTFFAISLILSLLVFIGEAVRDTFDTSSKNI